MILKDSNLGSGILKYDTISYKISNLKRYAGKGNEMPA